MAALTELSLFSGAGGGLLGTTHLLGWRTVCYVEWDAYAVEVIKARIRDGYLHDAPIWNDAFTFDGRPWAGLVDVVTAGFPCQPFSVAGKGLAENDPRNGWPAVIRILREVRPRFALLENVPNLLAKPYARVIFGELAEAGFDARWDCISAAELGANHRRERLWIVAYAVEWSKHLAEQSREEGVYAEGDGVTPEMADARGQGLQNAESQREIRGSIAKRSRQVSLAGGERETERGDAGLRIAASLEGQRADQRGGTAEHERGEWWEVEPELGRVADGVADRLDRLRAIGNGQVPSVVREAWARLNGR